jgi:ribosomal protein L9
MRRVEISEKIEKKGDFRAEKRVFLGFGRDFLIKRESKDSGWVPGVADS